MKVKRIITIIACIIAFLLILAITFLLVTNKQYTIAPREMPGATALDGESYIKFADIDTVTFYTVLLHYDNAEEFQDNYGAMDIVDYYSVDCNYVGNGTKIDCEVVEKNKDRLVLHYYGIGVTSEGAAESVDDNWEINMKNLWKGNYAKPILLNNN